MEFLTKNPNYEQIPSAIEGISVYRPRPEEKTDLSQPQTYTCPQCGASTKFNVAAGGVACEYCGYQADVEAEKVGRGAQELEFTIETWQQAEQGWGVERREMHCENCGAILAIDEGAITTTCPFCASNKVNVRAAISDVLRPGFVIPFKVKADQLVGRSKEWLGKGWFHPSELRSSAMVDHFTGIYLPYWTFDTVINASWRAEVGHEKTERYYDSSSKSWKTRTKIEWRWENGSVHLNIDDFLVSGSSQLSRVILGRIKSFNLDDLAEYSSDFLAGWQAQAYDITLPEAWEDGKESLRELAKKSCYEDINSSHVRNFSMTADFGDETWRYLLLPVYLTSYRFEGKAYQVMANGQNGEIAGQKPVAWWKIWLAVAALLIPGLFLALIGLPLLLLNGAGVCPIALGLVFLGLGGVASYKIYQQAVASEAS